MANPTSKRLQVFVSSTYEDLKPERQAAVEAILEARHIPAGMELFAAGDQSQMEVIRRWIDDSDVFLLILGGRYGSIESESGKSYTHLEFEHAVANGKPRFACVISEEATTKRGEKEGGSKLIELENPAKLKDFRAEVLKSMVEIWEDVKDIKLGIHKALSEIARRQDLRGWVRGDVLSNGAKVANDLAISPPQASHSIQRLNSLLASAPNADLDEPFGYESTKWRNDVENVLVKFFGEGSREHHKLLVIPNVQMLTGSRNDERRNREQFRGAVLRIKALLASCADQLAEN